MRQTGMWFFLSCKRYLRRFSFVLILLCLPAGAWWMGKLEKSGDSESGLQYCMESVPAMLWQRVWFRDLRKRQGFR